jgi:hypothetical protein
LLPLLIATSLFAAEAKPRFRTDADGPVKVGETRSNPKDKKSGNKPDWYRLVPGEFPPEHSAHSVTGELIFSDHLERRFQIRVDRSDSQDRGVWDRPLDATMLPYGSIWYHGAPAALQDIPLGTHLRGLFYLADPEDKTPLPVTTNNRRSPEWEFRRCFRIEDDFSFHARQNQHWMIESVDLTAMKLHAVLVENGRPVSGGKAHTFDLQNHTRVWKGRGLEELKALQAGQTVLFNLTWVTLYGPGRLTDIWLDDQSRAFATQQQLETHRTHVRERGLAGFVSAVEDEPQFVTVTFFGGVDPKLFEEITVKDPNAKPPADGSPPPAEPIGRLAVARDSLMTFDPVNDTKRGTVLEVRNIPVEPGSSGVQVKLKVDMMLEGYRPKRVVRFYPPTWKVIALPIEEQFQGRE